jgi:hypothetical protein
MKVVPKSPARRTRRVNVRVSTQAAPPRENDGFEGYTSIMASVYSLRAQTFAQKGSVFHGVCSPLLSKIRRRRLGQRSNTDGSFLPELRSTEALACAKSLCPLAHTGEVRNNHTALVHPSIFGRFGDGTCPQRCRRLWCSSPVTE